MKYKFIILALLVTLFGCKKIDKLTQFEMSYQDSFVIPSSTGINLPFNVVTPEVETNSESTFSSNDTRKDLIEEIYLKSLCLSVHSPENADFSFLNSIEIYINAENLDEVLIAKKDVISPETKTLSLDPTGVNLKNYILKEKYSLRINTKTDEIITSDHQINMTSIFFVDAKILGL